MLSRYVYSGDNAVTGRCDDRHHPHHTPDPNLARLFANMAVQWWLGLLPQRRSRPYPANRHNPIGRRPHLERLPLRSAANARAAQRKRIGRQVGINNCTSRCTDGPEPPDGMNDRSCGVCRYRCCHLHAAVDRGAAPRARHHQIRPRRGPPVRRVGLRPYRPINETVLSRLPNGAVCDSSNQRVDLLIEVRGPTSMFLATLTAYLADIKACPAVGARSRSSSTTKMPFVASPPP